MYTFHHIRIFRNCRRNVEEPFLFRKELKFVHIYFDIASSLSQIVMICLIMFCFSNGSSRFPLPLLSQNLEINYFTLTCLIHKFSMRQYTVV